MRSSVRASIPEQLRDRLEARVGDEGEPEEPAIQVVCPVGFQFRRPAVNKKRKWYPLAVPALRACRVTLRSAEGVAHTVEVTAETLFEAAALGLAELRREPWANPILPTATLEVSVSPPATKHRVQVGAIQRWLAAAPVSPRESILKMRLRGLLGLASRT